jgi:hypothetical protein
MKNLQVNIYDTDLKWRGMLEEVESLVHRTSFNEIVLSEMKVSRTSSHFSEIQVGRILVVNNRLDKALLIEEIEYSIPDEFITVNLSPLKGILNYRLLVPFDSEDFKSQRQGVVMAELVKQQLVTQTRDINRRFTNSTGVNLLHIYSPSRTYGDLIDYYTKDWVDLYLGDIITQISRMGSGYQLGWNISISPTYENLLFDTYRSTDRTINQTLNPPVIFSTEFGNIQKIDYFESIKEWKNHIFTVYEDELEKIFHVESENQTEPAKSFKRRELFLESNQKSEASASTDGISELNKHPKVQSFSCEVIDNPHTMSTFERDWYIGDIVTVQFKEFGIQFDLQVLEVEEVFSDNIYTIRVSFGEGKPSVLKIIKNHLQSKRKSNY